MRLYTYKMYSLADKARMGGLLFLSTIKRHLATQMGRDLAARIEPLLEAHKQDERGSFTRYYAQVNLLTEAQEKQIATLMLPLKTEEPVAAEVARKIREDVIAILMQPLSELPPQVQAEEMMAELNEKTVLNEVQEQRDLKIRKLVFNIYRLCEKQYRKGYQQGFHAGFGNSYFPVLDVDNWREEGAENGYRTFVDPNVGKPEDNKRRINQILSECRMDDMEELIQLLELYPDFNP